MLKRHMLEVLLPMLCVFCISSIGYTEKVIEKQKKTQAIKTPTQSVKPASEAEYIRTIEQDAASMKARTKQLTQMIRRTKDLRGEQRSKYLEKAVRDANSLLRQTKAFEKKLGDLHIAGPESDSIKANKAKIRRHLDEIQVYVSEAISITSQSVAGPDFETAELAEDAGEPVAIDCASNIDREDCSGYNLCYSCCRRLCGDVPDAEDSRPPTTYWLCIHDCRSDCCFNYLACILRLMNESNTNNMDALTGL
jgi:hypothetical protein